MLYLHCYCYCWNTIQAVLGQSHELKGKPVEVKEAAPREQRGGGGGGGGGGFGGGGESLTFTPLFHCYSSERRSMQHTFERICSRRGT
jgi:hypothetical protein